MRCQQDASIVRRLVAFGLALSLALSGCTSLGGENHQCLGQDLVIPASLLEGDPLTRRELEDDPLGGAVLGLYEQGGTFEEFTELLDQTDGFLTFDERRVLFLTGGQVTTVIEMDEVRGTYEFASLESCTLVAETPEDERIPATFEVLPFPTPSESRFRIGVFSSKCDNRTDNPGVADLEVTESVDAVKISVWVERFDKPLIGCVAVGNEIFLDIELQEPLGTREIQNDLVIPPAVVWPLPEIE